MRIKNGKLIASEEEEQKNVIDWAEKLVYIYPALKLLFHIPNGGKRNKSEAGRFKAMGVKAGVPDLFLPVPRGNFHGLWVEMKRVKNSKISPNQEWWIKALRSLGYSAEIAYGAEQAKLLIQAYLELR